MYVWIFASLQGINVKKQMWGWTGIQTPLHTETEVWNLRFWVLFNLLRLRQFCSGTWLWSPAPVASDQTKSTNPFPHRSFMMSGYSHLSALCLLHPIPQTMRAKWASSSSRLPSLWYHWSITGLHWGILRHHFDGIRPCLVMNVVLGNETWMKGNENWQNKTLEGEGLMQFWPDQCGQTQLCRYTVLALARVLRNELNCLHVSNLIYTEDTHTYCSCTHAKKKIRQH